MLSTISHFSANPGNDHACCRHEAQTGSAWLEPHHADHRSRRTEITYALCVVATGVLLLATAV